MKKTSIYLSEAEVESLRRLAAATGRPQAELVREAITEYVASHQGRRTFLLAGAGKGTSSKRRGTADRDLDRELRAILAKRARREESWRSSSTRAR